MASSADLRAFWFQFTHPRGVRHNLYQISLHLSEFQFTHPRGVRLPETPRGHNAIVVSIHAPARGATFGGGFFETSRFQFTHPRGVRPLSRSFMLSIMLFQFTHPRGVRLLVWVGTPAEVVVSIHAPARGATVIEQDVLAPSVVSIHAPARGATAGMGRWLWSCLYRPALAKVLKLSLLSGAAST